MVKTGLKSLEKELSKKVKQKQEIKEKVKELIKLEKEQELQKQEQENKLFPEKLELAKKLFEWKNEFQKTKQFKQIFETLELPQITISTNSNIKPSELTWATQALFLANNEEWDEEKTLVTYKSNQTLKQKIELYYGTGSHREGAIPTDKLKNPETAAKELPLELLKQTIKEIDNKQIFKNIEDEIK